MFPWTDQGVFRGSKMRRAQTKSSFNGLIEEMQDMSVDNFQDTECKAYFLSHCHTDHTAGLFSDALLEYLKSTSRVYIYMSELSAAIIKHESNGSGIVDYIKPLEIGTTTVTIPGNEVTETEDVYISVSLIPAGHCFGSVMFLFRTPYKNVLYSGDFRISTNSVAEYSQLHENGKVIDLDALYVDTTFLTDVHAEFPKRGESVRVTARHIKAWLHTRDTNRVALHTSARYGYEFVFNKLWELVGEKVYVGEDIWKLYSQFPNSITGVTNDPTNSKIHLCKHRTETKSHDVCLPNHQANLNFLYIHFSALKWTGYDIEDNMIQIKRDSNYYRIDVCFATHCSKTELEYFVNYLSPTKVVGFPNEYIRNDSLSKRKTEGEKDDSGDESDSGDENGKEVESEEVKLLDVETMRELFGDICVNF